jgi:hypothetical protein
VAASGVVYAGSSYDTRAMLAIKLDGAKGDITGTVKSFGRAAAAHRMSLHRCSIGDTIYNLQHYQGVMVRST